MVKIWSVELRRSYNIDDCLSKVEYEVVANNPADAVIKARKVHKKKCMREFLEEKLVYKYATSVKLIVTESV